MENTLDKDILLISNDDITTAIETFNNCVQSAAWSATPHHKATVIVPMYPQIATDLTQKKDKPESSGNLLDTPRTEKGLTNLPRMLKACSKI